jgi:uncharacterized protein YecE (DUF72 family)
LSTFLVGTSGYVYSWNKGKTNKFDWYLSQGFNSVEINGSFYRFPTENWTSIWKKSSTKGFKFSIKVNRAITHYTRLKGNKSVNLWRNFRKTLEPIRDRIAFWLFQMPSSFKFNDENIERLRMFETNANLDENAILEFRDASWWSRSSLKALEKLKISVCSIDAPLLPTKIMNFNNIIYFRLHGSKSWYNYTYSEKELRNIITKLQKMPGSLKAIYLNNDHGMLPNAKFLLEELIQKDK